MDDEMTPRSAQPDALSVETPPRLALTLLMLGNIVIGTGVLAPAAMMNTLTADLNVGPTQIGALIGWGAVILCIGAPTAAFLSNGIGRRTVLIGALVVYAAGHIASAFAPDYETLLAIRMVMIGGAAVYTPQAASAVTLMIGAERRPSAIAYVFLGWSVATAAVTPLITILGDQFGWRAVYWALGLGAAFAAAALWRSIPARLTPAALSLRDWLNTLSRPAIAALLLVTYLQVLGQFTLFPYIASELRRAAGADANGVALVLAVYGIAGLGGAAITARIVGRFSAANLQAFWLSAMAAGIALWMALSHDVALAAVAALVWGSGFAAAVSMQQARLIAIAPALASASVALNTSVLYLGQASGSGVGAVLIDAGANAYLGAFGVAFMLAAIAASIATQRKLGV
ncbi:MAG: MFS transporter [Alphaproteobacteria bacterium]|nr:MFS transporter [Alphaproteobacteria bacterium]